MSDQETVQYLRDLRAPIKSFRLYAIEYFIREGRNREVVSALETAQKQENDEECRLLLTHALNAVKQRAIEALEPASKVEKPLDAAGFPVRYSVADAEERLALLRRVKNDQLLVLAPFAVDAFQQEKHPLVAREIIRRFHPVWPKDRRQVLGRSLASEWQTVRFAALEALTIIAPRDLIVHLPALLRHADPRVRSMAIRALAAIDPSEAAKHLEALLLSPDVHHRWSALRECARLPFELTKPLLLAFLAVENDAALLDAACAVVAANPDPEVPWRVADLLAQRPEHAQILEPLLQTSINALQVSGQLSEKVEVYRQRLQQQVEQATVLRQARQALAALQTSDGTLQAEAQAVLRRCLPYPRVREMIADEVWKSTSESLRARLQEVLKSPSEPTAEKDTDTWERCQSDAEKVRWLATRQAGQVGQLTRLLPGILSAPSTSASIKAAALRTACRCRVPGLTPLIDSFLRHSDDSVVAAALEYHAQTSPDEANALIGRYLKSGRSRVRVAAIRVLRRTDPLQAVSSLFAMLNQKDPGDRALSLQCLVQFEFSLVRDRLLDLLESGKAPELSEDILALFEANPEVGLLYPLFRLARRLGGAKANQVDRVRSRMAELLVKMGHLKPKTLAELEGTFPARLQEDRKRRPMPAPAYSLKVLTQESESFWTKLGHTAGQGVKIVAALLLVILVAGVLLSRWAGGAGDPKELKKRTGAVIQVEPARGSGRILQITDFGWKVRLENGAIWHLSPPPGGFPFIIEGMKVAVEARLFRVGADGAFQGTCVSFKISL
ncbi:MAG TPA: HEAT repeat domain-containing protein [Candidatus Ozemobacteraceae bacterium]|nr:HEAT repeat domain-containing protein [Candidatus Ozemobacteraceae bacterium]